MQKGTPDDECPRHAPYRISALSRRIARIRTKAWKYVSTIQVSDGGASRMQKGEAAGTRAGAQTVATGAKGDLGVLIR
jgi:hypothetical protein